MKKIPVAPVVALREGKPLLVNWNGRTHYVQRVLASWEEKGKWWINRRRREYFKVELEDGIYEMCHHSGQWKLTKLSD